MIGSSYSWQSRRKCFFSRACSWRLHEAKQSQAHNNHSSQVGTHGYLILETGAWDRRSVAPTFFAFFSLSVALNRMSTTDLQTVSPHPNINPHGPSLRTGRAVTHSQPTHGIAAERCPVNCSVHRARRLQLPQGKSSSFCISARSHSSLLAPTLTRRGWWARTPIRREEQGHENFG
jgi:hypothetical protein